MERVEAHIEIPVRSLSRPVQAQLSALPLRGQRLGVFSRSIDVQVGEAVWALVTPALENGPFSIVLAVLPTSELPAEFELIREADTLDLGPWRLQLKDANVWEPRPDWERWRPNPAAWQHLRALAIQEARRRPALSPLGSMIAEGGRELPAVTALGQGLAFGDPQLFQESVAALAGWGPGLTPSGDDFLAGVLLALQIHPLGPGLCRQIAAAAVPLTTRLSGAFLTAARDGLATEPWHRLLVALQGEDPSGADLPAAVRGVLAFGAHSGLDMLSGFLWGMNFSALM